MTFLQCNVELLVQQNCLLFIGKVSEAKYIEHNCTLTTSSEPMALRFEIKKKEKKRTLFLKVR